MKPEDKYVAGLAGGLGIGTGGVAAYRYGVNTRAQGLADARANRGGRGMQVRASRLSAAGRGMQADGTATMASFKRSVSPTGKVTYFNQGKFAAYKKPLSQIAQGKASIENGRSMLNSGANSRINSRDAISSMKKGKFVRRGGVAIAALGGVMAAGSVGSAEYNQNRLRRNASRRPVVSARELEGAARQERINGR